MLIQQMPEGEHTQLSSLLRQHDKIIGISLVILFFAVIYAQSLTFVYVEGDDATTMAYHALGRNPSLQPPYSAYQSMTDGILALFPPNEHVVRTCGMILTSLGSPLLAIFIALLAFEWAPAEMRMLGWSAAILVPLLSPEFIYLGLVYTPAIMALGGVMAAHLLLRRTIKRSGRSNIFRQPSFWGSALLFGAGAACRWDILAYGSIVVLDIWLGLGGLYQRANNLKVVRFRTGFTWGIIAIACWLAWVTVNGYSPSAVLHTLRQSGPVEQYPSLVVTMATIQPYATPAVLAFGLIGGIVLARRRHPLLLVTAFGLLLVARFFPYGVPKWLLVALPALTICALLGFARAWWFASNGLKAFVVRTAAILLIAAPWFVGVHVLHGDSAYGPGFEVKPFDRPVPAKSTLSLAFGPGALVPTSEGPRSIGGHAWVLLGGAWRKNVTQGAEQISTAVRQALMRKLPLLVDEQQGFVVAKLLAMHFATSDPWDRTIADGFAVERTFTSENGNQQLRLLELKNKPGLLQVPDEHRLEEISQSSTLIIYAYTSTLRTSFRIAPDSLERIGSGTNAAILHLDKLRLAKRRPQLVLNDARPVDRGPVGPSHWMDSPDLYFSVNVASESRAQQPHCRSMPDRIRGLRQGDLLQNTANLRRFRSKSHRSSLEVCRLGQRYFGQMIAERRSHTLLPRQTRT